jgi:hypothetical protein
MPALADPNLPPVGTQVAIFPEYGHRALRGTVAAHTNLMGGPMTFLVIELASGKYLDYRPTDKTGSGYFASHVVAHPNNVEVIHT